MKIGVVSDVHGNRQALLTVLGHLEYREVDRVVCTGDIIGILGWSEECVEIVRERCDDVVFGNHDARLRSDFIYQPSFPSAQDEHMLVSEQLSAESVEYISGLPDRIETDEYILAHSWPKEYIQPETSLHGFKTGDYGVKPRDFTKAGKSANGKAIMLGHTHEQHGLKLDKFEGLSGLVLNPGSVGTPWYGEAEYAIVDTETHEYQLESIEYNNESVGRKLDELDEEFGLRTWADAKKGRNN